MFKTTGRYFASGFLMGAADVVPGVSGGTIALVLGIYERLIQSIRSGSSALGALLRGDLQGFRSHLAEVEWAFLLTLLAGILSAVLSLAHIISLQLEENPFVLAAGFFGLVVGSTMVAFRLIRQIAMLHVVVAILVGAIVFVVLGIGSNTVSQDPSPITYFASGALAICAMILPGISGSLILVLIGMYEPVLAAVKDRDIWSIGVFALGAIVGLAIFSQALHWALRRAHDLVLASLIGLMVGSLRILWPWPDGVEGPGLEGPGVEPVLPALLAGVIGFGLVLWIARLGRPRQSSG